MTPMRLISLIVHAHPMRSPKWAADPGDEAGEHLGRVGGLPPPRAVSHVGVVK